MRRLSTITLWVFFAVAIFGPVIANDRPIVCRVDGVLQVPFDLHQCFLHNIATGRTRHKSPLGPLVNILMMALTDGNVSRSPEPIPDALESVAFLFERATSTEIKIDLQKANLHLLGSCPEIALS